MNIDKSNYSVYFTLFTAKEMLNFSKAVYEHSEYDTDFAQHLDEYSTEDFKPNVIIQYLDDINNGSVVAEAFCCNGCYGVGSSDTMDILINWVNANMK